MKWTVAFHPEFEPEFAAGNKHDGNPLRIERKGHAPLIVHRLEPRLLHVRVVGAFQRTDMRASR